MIKFEFKLIQSETVYLIPNFIKCIHCSHEIPISDLLRMEKENDTPFGKLIIDRRGCGKASDISHYLKRFGVIENIS